MVTREPIPIKRTLGSLFSEDRLHWELHLKAVMKDTPSCSKEVRLLLRGAELPKLKHPSDIHDWLEQPDKRIYLEVLNG